MLVLRDIDLPCLLVDLVVAPPGVHPRQLCRDPVVLPHEQGVKDDQIQLLIHTEVAREEAIVPLAATNVAPRHFPLLFSRA